MFDFCWQEANESGALRLAKSKLEKQLEDLTWRLQLEKRLRVSFVFLVLSVLNTFWYFGLYAAHEKNLYFMFQKKIKKFLAWFRLECICFDTLFYSSLSRLNYSIV